MYLGEYNGEVYPRYHQQRSAFHDESINNRRYAAIIVTVVNKSIVSQ